MLIHKNNIIWICYMPHYVDNTPKKEDYEKKFNEPKNVMKSSSVIAAAFEEESAPQPKMQGYLEEDENNNYVVVTSYTDHCPAQPVEELPYASLSEPEFVFITEDISTDTLPPVRKPLIHANDTAAVPAEAIPVELKMNGVTRLYIGSLSIIGLLILFRMLYKPVKA